MNHFSSEDLKNAFAPKEVIDIVKNGIQKYAEGKYKVPDRMHIHRGESTNLIMPAFGEKYYCTKLISVDPHNHLNNFPFISGILVLNDASTGETLATMDAPMLTALRTAAVGSIGLELIYPKKSSKIGIIGLGVQGYWQTIYAASMSEISDIYCYSRSKTRFDAYHKKVKEKFPKINIIWCASAEEVVRSADAIITCTTSKNPVFNAANLDIRAKRFISVGSFAKDMQELPDDVYRQADTMIIDSKSAETEVGDVINTLKNNWISRSNIITLADISNGNRSIEENSNAVFKSVGMAAFDLAFAAAIYEYSS